jgi:hemolysin activation/secretion protein
MRHLMRDGMRVAALRVAAGVAMSVSLPMMAVGQATPIEQPPITTPSPAEAAPAPAPRAAAAAIEDGPAFAISRFDLLYAVEHPDRPSLEDLRGLPVTLGTLNDALVAPREGVESVTISVGDLMTEQRATRKFAVSGINAVGSAIVAELNRRGFVGVLVAPDPGQVEFETLKDLRSGGTGPMTLLVWTRTVQGVRTIGDGARWGRDESRLNQPRQDNRINHPFHQRIRENSPLQPTAVGSDQPGDMLRKDALEDYLFRLNRHPARRVDAAIAAGDTPGSVVLDYIVAENRPWTAYAQLSNTGTQQTSEWRQRFGFIHNQLTNRDDTLAIDFVTASFDKTNALSVSYEAPLGKADRLRWKIYGGYSDFEASDVGFVDETFEGTTWSAGGELIWNAWQRRMNFIDVFGGMRWQNVEVNNNAVDLQGQEDFFIPYFGARFERNTMRGSTNAEVRMEFGLGGDESEVVKLGRVGADEKWSVLKWNVSQSFYLEPLLRGAAWSDPSTPDSKTTLAHEVALSLRGQTSFGNRLVPQEQEVAGGLYSVRGYKESATAGDNVVIASAEYRLHLPRLWDVQSDPSKTPVFGSPFRVSRQTRYGLPDWDLVFKGFIDVGRVTNSDRAAFESDETLMSIGPGVELAFRRNISLRLDLGIALQDAGPTKSGDSRLHFVGTVLY